MLSKNRVKYIQSLKQKKFRQKYGQFLVEGEKSVAELLHSNFIVDEILAVPDWIQRNLEISGELKITECDETQLRKISAFSSASPVCAVAQTIVNDVNLADDSWTIVLDGIKDPGNLGTIIRTADWYGIKNIVCSVDCVDFYNSKVISSTMGSFSRIQPVYANLLDFLKSTPAAFACVLGGESIRTVQSTPSGTLIIGSESHGIRPDIINLPQVKLITIPGIGLAESLNAAIATGIALDRLVDSVELK
jgi:RNA methyltransferase, TrmH family